MEKEMTGADRRKKLIFLMRESEQPLSGTQLGQVTGVSRQVVVQDIALLRRVSDCVDREGLSAQRTEMCDPRA